LNYRMHHRAGRAIRAVLEGNVEPAVRNEAAFRLARIHFQKDQPARRVGALSSESTDGPESRLDPGRSFLRANVLHGARPPGRRGQGCCAAAARSEE
jgi:hypothetical protein